MKRGQHPDPKARPLTLAGVVEEHVRTSPERVAVIMDGDDVSYGALWDRGITRRDEMLALGVRPGDRVGVLLPNGIPYLEIVLGASMMGAVIVPMNIRYKSRELRHLIVDSGMVLLYSQDSLPGVVDFAGLLSAAFPELKQRADRLQLSISEAPALRAIVSLDGPSPFMLGIAEIPRPRDTKVTPPDASQALFIMYTSGSTSAPKGCIVPHRAIISNAWAIVDVFGLTPEDTWWCPLPMFHIGGLLFVITMLAVGGQYSGLSHFEADKAIAALDKHPPTVFYPLFPTITLPIIDHPGFARLDHRRMRIMVNLAPPEVQRRVQATVPHAPILGAFGMTETCGTVCYGRPADPVDSRLHTCGRPLEGWSVKIVDAVTRAELAPGERGEIAVKGQGLFDGYLNAPELTARQHLPDGFFLTGDVGLLDAAGQLVFHGRIKDQLKVGGENVSALEVESFLSTHSAVANVQVVGIADERYGEVPAAFVELRGGARVSEQELIGYCTDQIARFKIPRYVRFVTEWPMSATKVQKFRLREQLESELRSG